MIATHMPLSGMCMRVYNHLTDIRIVRICLLVFKLKCLHAAACVFIVYK